MKVKKHEASVQDTSCLINSKNIGRHALFSYRARYDVTEFSNCDAEERSEAKFFCAV